MPAYPEKIRQHYTQPRNVGAIKFPSGRGRAENRGCGDVLQVDVEVDASGVVVRILFLARACSAVIAMASIVTEVATGLSVDEVRALDVERMAEDAGGLPRSKAHATRVVKRALTDALQKAAGS